MLELKSIDLPTPDDLHGEECFFGSAIDNNGLEYRVYWDVNLDYINECNENNQDYVLEYAADWFNPMYVIRCIDLEEMDDVKIVEKFSEPGENKYVLSVWKNEHPERHYSEILKNEESGNYDGTPVKRLIFDSYEEALAARPKPLVRFFDCGNGYYRTVTNDWKIELCEPVEDGYEPINYNGYDDRVTKQSYYKFIWCEDYNTLDYIASMF